MATTMNYRDENAAPSQQKAGGVKKSPKKAKTIEETYTKKTQLEHILLRPDTYIGSVEKQTQLMWVLDAQTKQLVNRNCSFVPGLYKIFDEIIVNAADNKQRDPTMNRIEVTINPDENFVRVWNNGNGIPIAMHAEHQIYVPELIFGHLLTGSNFDDNEAKTTGGRNGYGAKLANIFSKEFVVETADRTRGLKYKQVYKDNMGSRTSPTIEKFSGTDFTSITFSPDLKRFKMEYMDEDIVSLLSKRVYDVAATTSKIAVYLNGTRVNTVSFEQYIGNCAGLEPPCAFERINERWEVGVAVSDGTFQQVSFVNSIATIKGGTHVNYITDQITAKLAGVVKKRNKGQEVKPGQIKNHLAVFVNALVVNPAFDSQTKENLTTKASALGSTCVLPEKFLKNIEKSCIIEHVLNWAKFKQVAELKKKGGSKKSKLVGITKLDDANCAGTSRSRDCTLILTEGDSAKALAISGLGVVGRDYYGVFPLKGKLLNVREANHAQIMKNEEIQNIAKILGLTFGKEYDDASSLRYGHLMIMTDQDHDGSHIKGLLINFLHHFWPSLLKIDGFLKQFITPIVKCTKGKKELTFFTIPQYMNWKEDNADGKGWKIKYYKGLGTSTSAEAKEYFSHLETHELDFEWDPRADDMIDMAFAKKRVDDRKLWLLSMEPGVHIDYDVDRITYDNFINKELILFSHADNERSLPHFMDGFKPSQRKVLFACFKRNLKQEIKVAQLAGYISEHSAYHHGEASLTQTIIGMAQNFVGSNNINLLSPCGQFGTRLMGGKDAASPRYVFTKLETITRCIFHPHDDPLLAYLDDDGQSIEPEYYVPIIPMALVNGADGIGTGWSTSVPTYNPREIIANLRLMIAGEAPVEMHPWFRGFVGDIAAKTGKDCNNYVVSGLYEQSDEQTIVISELPVGRWTTDYKQMLEGMLVGAVAQTSKEDGTTSAALPSIVKDFKENHTDTTVLFTVTVLADKLAEAANEKGGIQKKFKLDGSVSTTNMTMFDSIGQIHKYESPMEIMNAFYDVRVDFYNRRKFNLLGRLTEEWEKLDNKVRFILAVIAGKLVVSNRKKTELLSELKATGFKVFVDKKGAKKVEEGGDEEDEEEDDHESSAADLSRGYDYLLSMKIWSLTMEKVQSLTSERNTKKDELDILAAKTAEDLWLEDLDALEVALDDFEGAVEAEAKQERLARKKAQGSKSAKARGGGGGGGGVKKVSKTKSEWNSDEEDDDDVDEDDDDASDFDDEPKKKKAASSKPKPSAKPPVVFNSAAAKPKAAPVAAAPSAPAVAKKVVAKPATAPAPKPYVPVVEEVLSLRERLAMKMGGSAAMSSLSAPAPAATTMAAKPAPATKPSVAKPTAAKAKAKTDVLDLCESDEEVVVAPVNRPARATAAKKTYAMGDSDEEDEDEDDDEDVSGDEEDDDDDFSDDDDKPKKAAKAKAAPVKKAAPAPAPAPVASKGIKRPKKSSAPEDPFAFSPGMSSPAAIKKPKKEEPKAKAAAKPSAAASKGLTKPTAAKSAPKPKSGTVSAVASKSKAAAAGGAKKRKDDSDDDESEAELDDDDDVQIVSRSPKPTRARKGPTNYATYFDDDEEEAEFDEDAESEFDD